VTTNRTKKKPRTPVVFVGAGPGDLGLLTMRAVHLLADADLVVHDQSVPAELLARYAPGTETVKVDSTDAAADRVRAAIDAARNGDRVVRLVAGDAVLDPAVAEELAACVRAKLPFEVVPGVPSATAVASYAGVPLLTAKSGSVHVVDPSRPGVDWALHSGSTTVVLHCGADALESAARALIAEGRSESTPVAVTADGTTTEQRTIVTTLAEVGKSVKAAKINGVVVAIIGDVVGAREKYSWFETRPLFGWRVLVPRTKEQAGVLSAKLEAYGAVPVEVPTISVEPPRAPQQMERAIHGLVSGRYHWVAFTSVNAVRAVRERFEEYGLDARSFAGIKVAAVGEQTAASLLKFGVRPDLVPAGDQSSAGLLEDWPEYDPVLDPMNKVFLPRADIATETLAAGLIERGWEPEDVTAYRTVRAAPPPADTREAIKSGGFDAVVFTSSSTVRNLIGIAGKPHASTVVACIGPATAKVAEEHGLRVDVIATAPSVDVLAEALADFGLERRAAAVESGEPLLRPSEKRAARRKAT
jgi:uroporphyrinogen III methyltransferase / synthase